MRFFDEPLFRLLAINLGIGVFVAVLLLVGLIALDPAGLRDLIVADRSPGVAIGLLLFGFLITFCSVAMGTAIMTIGEGDGGSDRGKRAGRGPIMLARSMVHSGPTRDRASRHSR